MFTTKAFIVPHLRMILAGTGAGGFLGKWFIEVNDRMVLKGIDNLDHHTPNSLASIWRRYKQEFSFPDTLTTTVYHLGFSEEDGLIHAYAYRSTDNFQSELLSPYGIRVKPECSVPNDYQLPTDIKKLMVEQRAIQASYPKEERIYIGGEINIHYLTENGFSVFTLDRFDDYDSVEQAIYDNHHTTQG